MDAKKILEKARWNKDTTFVDQISFVGDDGYQISVPRTKEGMTRKEAEEILVEAVQERYGA